MRPWPDQKSNMVINGERIHPDSFLLSDQRLILQQ